MPSDVPLKPIVALTLALAGKRQIGAGDLPAVEAALQLIFDAIGERLADLRRETARGPGARSCSPMAIRGAG